MTQTTKPTRRRRTVQTLSAQNTLAQQILDRATALKMDDNIGDFFAHNNVHCLTVSGQLLNDILKIGASFGDLTKNMYVFHNGPMEYWIVFPDAHIQNHDPSKGPPPRFKGP